MERPKHHFTASNREHFDQLARGYQQPSKPALELAKRVARAIRRRQELDDEVTELMDFACGAGLLSQQLAPYVKSIVGVDISQGMVDLYNNFVSNQGILPEEMQAVCVDLHKSDIEHILSGRTFDGIVCGLAYHHFESIADTTRMLVKYLKPDGFLIVVDLLKAEGIDVDEIFPEHRDQIVAHRGGFKQADLLEAFENSGLQLQFYPDIPVKKQGHELCLFLAKGTREVVHESDPVWRCNLSCLSIYPS